jgi:uncharacterized protein
MKTALRAAAALLTVAASSGAIAGVGGLQDAPRSFTVGTATAQRGQRAYGVLKVPAGSDAGYDIPVAVLHGARPGPVLAVVSGAHGTEYASIIAVEQLIDEVKPADLSGTLILVPIVNLPSFERLVPHLNPTDNKNMNRFYPGNPGGTQTERASAIITREIIERCDHLIDFHGGDLDENLRPYSYWTVTGNKAQDEASRAMVLAFGLDHIIVSTDRPKDKAASRYLEGVVNVLGQLKMSARAATPVARPIWIDPLLSVTSEYDGVFHPLVNRDAHVAKGAKIGRITDYLNRPLQEVVAPDAGVVLFVRAVPSLKKGDTLASIGVVKP